LDDVKQAGASHTESILHPRAFPFVLFVLVWAIKTVIFMGF